MRSTLTSSPVPQFLLRSFKNSKSLCSKPQVPNKPFLSQSPLVADNPDDNTNPNFPEKITSDTHFPGNPTGTESIDTHLPSPGSGPDNLTQLNVINTLLSHKDDPVSALKYFNRVEMKRDFVKSVDALCVLLHILMGSSNNRCHWQALNLLRQSNSCYSGPTTVVLIDRLVQCAERFDFDLDSRVFSYLLDSYVNADKINSM